MYLLAGSLGLCVALPLVAQTTVERKPAKPILSIEGQDSYAAYCAACHGKDGKGDGPAAPAMKGPIPDLTTIARRNDGKFDKLAITRQITGVDKRVHAHGSEDMPLWGPIFSSIQGGETATLRVRNLAEFLQTMQQK
jgi:mono/diheme cytochrome c family protein